MNESIRLEMEYKNPDDIKPFPGNARTHSQEQVAQVAASIKEFGFNNPILVDATGKIIAGHCRLMAAKKLGLERVPTINLGHLTDTQKRAYTLADNKIQLGADWDMEKLAQEARRLQDDGFDLDLTGFGKEEIADILAGVEIDGDDLEPTEETEPVPEPPEEPVTKKRDVWLLGAHYHCDDCGAKYTLVRGREMGEECPCNG